MIYCDVEAELPGNHRTCLCTELWVYVLGTLWQAVSWITTRLRIMIKPRHCKEAARLMSEAVGWSANAACKAVSIQMQPFA